MIGLYDGSRHRSIAASAHAGTRKRSKPSDPREKKIVQDSHASEDISCWILEDSVLIISPNAVNVRTSWCEITLAAGNTTTGPHRASASAICFIQVLTSLKEILFMLEITVRCIKELPSAKSNMATLPTAEHRSPHHHLDNLCETSARLKDSKRYRDIFHPNYRSFAAWNAEMRGLLHKTSLPTCCP